MRTRSPGSKVICQRQSSLWIADLGLELEHFPWTSLQGELCKVSIFFVGGYICLKNTYLKILKFIHTHSHLHSLLKTHTNNDYHRLENRPKDRQANQKFLANQKQLLCTWDNSLQKTLHGDWSFLPSVRDCTSGGR